MVAAPDRLTRCSQHDPHRADLFDGLAQEKAMNKDLWMTWLSAGLAGLLAFAVAAAHAQPPAPRARPGGW
jgi:hypothetical protein